MVVEGSLAARRPPGGGRGGQEVLEEELPRVAPAPGGVGVVPGMAQVHDPGALVGPQLAGQAFQFQAQSGAAVAGVVQAQIRVPMRSSRAASGL